MDNLLSIDVSRKLYPVAELEPGHSPGQRIWVGSGHGTVNLARFEF